MGIGNRQRLSDKARVVPVLACPRGKHVPARRLHGGSPRREAITRHGIKVVGGRERACRVSVQACEGAGRQ